MLTEQLSCVPPPEAGRGADPASGIIPLHEAKQQHVITACWLLTHCSRPLQILTLKLECLLTEATRKSPQIDPTPFSLILVLHHTACICSYRHHVVARWLVHLFWWNAPCKVCMERRDYAIPPTRQYIYSSLSSHLVWNVESFFSHF